jgi:SAM-dependent methyltransferase
VKQSRNSSIGKGGNNMANENDTPTISVPRTNPETAPQLVVKPTSSRAPSWISRKWASLVCFLERDVIQKFIFKKQREKISLLLGGHIFFQTLSAAVELGLFDLLERHGGMTQEAIAKAFNIAEKPARIVLMGCASLGLIKKRGEIYTNSAIAKRFLTTSRRGNLVPIVRWQHHINYRPLQHFYAAIKANTNVGLAEIPGGEPTLYERLTHDPVKERIFQDAMESISVQANRIFSQYVDLTRVRYLVDVGGGNATNIINLARRYPRLRASVFDSSSVCEIARANIQAAGLERRLDAIPGDCFKDPFPADADCYLFCHFFTIWSEKNNRELLKKAFKSLPPNGRVIIFNMMQENNGQGPLSAALGSPYFLTLATGEGMLYTWAEYENWMKSVGFEVQRYKLPSDHGAIIGIKPGV